MYQVNIHEAKTHFSKLLKKVLDGEEVIIAKGNRPVAKLVSYHPDRPKRKLGSAKGEVWIAPDFDEPLDEFEEYQR